MKQTKSNKQVYAENRELYFDKVISLYSHGMTMRKIALKFPIGKSTVQRWINEYIAKECDELPDDIEIPRTPASVAKTIRAMQTRITKLETELNMYRKNGVSVKSQSQHNAELADTLTRISGALQELCELLNTTINRIK